MDNPSTAPRVLLVDDHPDGIEALRSVLASEGYEIRSASSGPEALESARKLAPDVILLDVMMPGMDGFEVCRILRADPRLAEVPVVMVTALEDRASRLSAIDAGADDFISKPIDREEVRARVRSITRLNRYRRIVMERERVDRLLELSPDGMLVVDRAGTIRLANPEIERLLEIVPATKLVGQSLWDLVAPEERDALREFLARALDIGTSREKLETTLLSESGATVPTEISAGRFPLEDGDGAELLIRDITERHEQLAVIRTLNSELSTAYDATLIGWVRALDLRHKETEGHSKRVMELTVRLAREIGIAGDQIVHVRRGALLHDVGKIAVPDHILLKPGPLTANEWEVMRRHPANAIRWLSPLKFLEPALDIPHYHHERWDGRGYPEGLAGTDIPLAARIFSVVDVWDALVSDRPYRRARPPDHVRDHLRTGAGTHFDPEAVEAFVPMTGGLAASLTDNLIPGDA